MATTKTELVNKALTLVGAAPITNLDDNSNNARIINRVYEVSLRSILAECKWNFATKRIMLTVSSDTLAWYDTGNTFIYQRPADVIKIYGVNVKSAEWRDEGEYIISDTQGLGIRYVQFLDVPSKYTASFIDAFIDKLCSDIAYMIVNSASLGDKFIKLYEGVSLPKALSSNAQVGTQQFLQDDAWELAKFQDRQPNA